MMVSRRLTSWSIVTVVLAVPVWYAVVVLGLMPRTSLDGGIFVSVVGGIRDGLPLYSGVWDNKDPLFFLVMTGASLVSTAAMFVLDWLWVLVGSVGAWLLARPLMSGDRALLVGFVLAPVVLVAPFHEAGMSSLPGTAVAVLALGLLLNRWGIAAGVVVGLLAFLKLIVWPIVVLAILVLLFMPSTRRAGVRSLVAMAGTLVVGVAALLAAGWLGPYLDALGRNRTYASDVIVYFGYEDSPIGHLRRMADDWAQAPSGTAAWVAVAAMAVVLGAAVVVAFAVSGWRTPERIALVAWLGISIAGTTAILATTYVWGHHAQVLYLPALLAVVTVAAMVPSRWIFPGFLGVAVVATWLLAGWGAPSSAIDRVAKARDGWSTNLATIDKVPTDAKLLATVPSRDFTFARLGSNEDQGFLYSAPAGARLMCAQFHLYDFSPPDDFARMLDCIKDVDAVLMTDSFVVFGNGGRAASVQPILQYVDYAFDCMKVADRQICTRKRT